MFGDHGAPYTRGPMFIAVALTLLPIATIFVSLRFYCRAVLVKSVGVDDWIMLAAMIATWALGVVNIFHIKYGVGTPMEYLMGPNSMVEMVYTLKLWYSYQMLYLFCLFLVKISILCFYKRLSSEKSYRYSIYGVGGVITLYTIIMIFVNAFECKNPSDAWALTWPKNCRDLMPVYFWQAGFNIASDLVILLLPIRLLLKLQVNKAKKIALLSIFSVGSIAVIASIVRLTGLYTYHKSKDIPYDAIWIILWSQVELNLAIISASAPSLKPLMKRTFGSSFLGKSLYGAGKSTGMGYDSQMGRSRKGDVKLDSVVISTKMNESEEEIMAGAKGEGIRRTTQIEVSSSPRTADTARRDMEKGMGY